ncbi:MAG: cation:proton antiporter [Candidatus Thermoplasmatota archaeon]|nr:cation:proton antiporter [Candidatus Thermoplasmatota archaeon]
MFDVVTALITIGVILVLGFIGNYIFNRTKIPSIIWLLFFGMAMGFIFNIRGDISPALLISFSEFFAAVAIVIILFDGGINTKLHELFRGARRGLLLTVSAFVFSMLGAMLVVLLLTAVGVLQMSLGDSLIVGLILGAIVGGTSGPIVIPLASRLTHLEEKTKTMLSIESIITDILCIVVVLMLVYMVLYGGGFNLSVGIKNLVSTFSIGAVLGLVLGLVWLPIMHKVRQEEFSYVVTLAVAFLVYSVTVLIVGVAEGGSGAGAIACLVFGLVLGNGKKVLKMFDYGGEGYEMDQSTREFHSLISFVMRTFFFVYLGIMVGFQRIEFIAIGIGTFLILLLMRYLAVEASTYRGGFEKDDKQTMLVMMPRGLAAAILALSFGPALVNRLMPGLDGFFEDIAFVVILSTALMCTVGVSLISHAAKKPGTTTVSIVHEQIDVQLHQESSTSSSQSDESPQKE